MRNSLIMFAHPTLLSHWDSHILIPFFLEHTNLHADIIKIFFLFPFNSNRSWHTSSVTSCIATMLRTANIAPFRSTISPFYSLRLSYPLIIEFHLSFFSMLVIMSVLLWVFLVPVNLISTLSTLLLVQMLINVSTLFFADPNANGIKTK